MGVSRKRRVLGKIWFPAVVVIVVLLAGFGIHNLHGIFASTDITRSDSGNGAIAQFNPKSITYEIFGDLDGWGRVSYWDVNSKPIVVELDSLPWTHTETTTMTTATADVTAQVAGGNIGCRITIDGLVRSEHTATGNHAGVWCQVLSA
jgi:hypothetical protein